MRCGMRVQVLTMKTAAIKMAHTEFHTPVLGSMVSFYVRSRTSQLE